MSLPNALQVALPTTKGGATYCDQRFGEERALYGSRGASLLRCSFDGPEDGESALKEASDVRVTESYCNLRYPFWHVERLLLENSELTPLCRAALWYTNDITVRDCRLHGIKALRECARVSIRNTDICSAEFGWSVAGLEMTDSTAEGEYFLLRARDVYFNGVHFRGKYSFQYAENVLIENSLLDTKDAFWHAKNVTVRNSTVRGEYLAWYSENLTLENCKIIGTQPLCYCKGLRLVNCEMEGTDLSFERSEVDAVVTSPIDSVKNPRAGTIVAPSVGEIIMDDPLATGVVVQG